MLADRGNDLQIEQIDLAGKKWNLRTGDAPLVKRSLPEFTAQHVGVIAAHVGQQRGDHVQRARLVVAPAHAGLDGRPLNIVFFKQGQGDQDRRLKEGMGMVRMLERKPDTVRLHHRRPKLGDVLAGSELTVDAVAFAIVEEMRAHEGAGFADGGQTGLQETAGALAARLFDWIAAVGRLGFFLDALFVLVTAGPPDAHEALLHPFFELIVVGRFEGVFIAELGGAIQQVLLDGVQQG